MEAVGSRRDLLASDVNVAREGDRRVLVCTGAPDLVVGHELAPDLALVHGRAVIRDGDVSQSHLLRDGCGGTGLRQRQRRPLCRGGGDGGAQCDENERCPGAHEQVPPDHRFDDELWLALLRPPVDGRQGCTTFGPGGSRVLVPSSLAEHGSPLKAGRKTNKSLEFFSSSLFLLLLSRPPESPP